MADTTGRTLKTTNANELKKWMNNGNMPVIINTLNKDAYRARHIPGSINIPVNEIEEVKSVVPDKNQPVVVYCADEDCEASPAAAKKMMEMGYDNVYDFNAGMAGWRNAGNKLTGNA